MLRQEEIAEEYEVTGIEVSTPLGMRSVTRVFKTVPLRVWRLETKAGYVLEASGHHLVKSEGEWVKIKNMEEGDLVDTEIGVDTVTKVVDTGRTEELYDISVDDPSHSFYSNGILSHNSTTICTRMLMNSHMLPGYQGLYIVPNAQQLKTTADRLWQMETRFAANVGTQNLYTKKYSNGSMIYMLHCGETANDARGKSSWEIIIDECAAWFTALQVRGSEDPVHIADVEVGAEVLCFDDNCNLRYDRVVDKQFKGTRECIRITVESGKSVVVTGNHKLRAETGWIYACEVEKGSTRLLAVDGDGTRWEEVVSVLYCGTEEVWDIETELHHTYVADGIGSHNCQSMDPTIIPDILECNQMSPLPITLYTGTAMSTETLLEQEWQKSSQGIWHIKAGDGRTWLNMHDEDTLLKVCDNPRGPTCPITGKILDVTDGHYEHMYPERLNRGYIGLHVPQVIIKDNVDNPLQWSKLYRKRQEYDTNKFLMECCGIAMAEGMREITQADLERMCDLQVDKEELVKRCNRGYYKLVVSGCDWGGSDYNQAAKTKTSYTVHCILGVAPNGMVDVLHFNRYAGMNYQPIGEDIVKNHLKFKGNVIVSDFGVGSAYNSYIRENLPVFSHFIAQFTAPNTAPLAPIKNSNLTNHVGINKTEAITNVFSDIKRSRIHAVNWGKMEQYLMDFLNVYRAPVDTEQGMTKFRWIRNATKADDALMAFTFAYVFVKMYTGERLVTDKAFERYVMDVMNGHPGRSSTPPHNFNYVI